MIDIATFLQDVAKFILCMAATYQTIKVIERSAFICRLHWIIMLHPKDAEPVDWVRPYVFLSLEAAIAITLWRLWAA